MTTFNNFGKNLNLYIIKLKFIPFHLTYCYEDKCPYCYIENEKRANYPPLGKDKRVIEKLAKGKIENIF